MTCARDIKNYLTFKLEGTYFYGNKHILKYKTSSFKYQVHILSFTSKSIHSHPRNFLSMYCLQ